MGTKQLRPEATRYVLCILRDIEYRREHFMGPTDVMVDLSERIRTAQPVVTDTDWRNAGFSS